MPDPAVGVHLAPSSLADLHRLAEAYKGGDKIIQKRMRTGLQAAAKPLAEQVVHEGSAVLPARGGLRARVAAARGGVTAALGGRNVAVSVRITDRQKDALGAMDSGLIRHPVFRTGAWTSQRVPAGGFSDAFKRGSPQATERVNAEIAKALDEIAREA
jgi:hypothetical protein